MNAALSVRNAMASIRRDMPGRFHVCSNPLSRTEVAGDFATCFAGIPAVANSRTEDVAVYTSVKGSSIPVLLGLYGDADRVRGWLPGFPARISRQAADHLCANAVCPDTVANPACQERSENNLGDLPVLQSTSRDAGPYITMGMIYAHSRTTGATSVSVHRMLVLDRGRLTLWMVPGRQLRALHDVALRQGERLPISINIGAPPAAMVASAVNTRFLPPGVTKLHVAGALAGAPITLAPALSQQTSVLAESEIVVEGFLNDSVADECLGDTLGGSLPEFLGYDGSARTGVPVITVTAITTRRDPVYQAVIGPGREQSVILGMGGSLSVALSAAGCDPMVRDLHFPPAGGGMLALVIAVRKEGPDANGRLGIVARQAFEQHPFLKLLIFVDEDVDITSAEDVLWAMTTRTNLGTDCTTIPGFRPLPTDPSQGEEWEAERGGHGASGRTFIDATVPYRLRQKVVRSFVGGVTR